MQLLDYLFSSQSHSTTGTESQIRDDDGLFDPFFNFSLLFFIFLKNILIFFWGVGGACNDKILDAIDMEENVKKQILGGSGVLDQQIGT